MAACSRCARSSLFTCFSISAAASSSASGLAIALAGNVWRRAVHRFEDRGLLADIGAGRHAEAADQARHLVGQNIAEEIGGHDHIELPRVHHELHGAGIDDTIVHRDPAFIFLGDVAANFEENAGQRLQHVGLVNDGDLLAAMA